MGELPADTEGHPWGIAVPVDLAGAGEEQGDAAQGRAGGHREDTGETHRTGRDGVALVPPGVPDPFHRERRQYPGDRGGGGLGLVEAHQELPERAAEAGAGQAYPDPGHAGAGDGDGPPSPPPPRPDLHAAGEREAGAAQPGDQAQRLGHHLDPGHGRERDPDVGKQPGDLLARRERETQGAVEDLECRHVPLQPVTLPRMRTVSEVIVVPRGNLDVHG